MMVLAHAPVGIGLSIGAAALWALSPLCFASAGRRIGAFPVVVLRALLAAGLLLAVLPLYWWLAGTGMRWPTGQQVFWLAASGLAGMAIGDGLYYEALVRLGPRRSSQAQVLAPVVAVTIGWYALGETLPWRSVLGIVLVMAGTAYALFDIGQNQAEAKDPGRVSAAGIAFAAAAAVCVGIGAVLGRQAFLTKEPIDGVVATTVRVSAAAAFLMLIPLVRRQVLGMLGHLKNSFVLSRVVPGTLAGPFAGMLCYVVALKETEAGLVSTLASMSPIFILPMVVFRYKARIGLDVVVATLLAAGGVALLSIR